MNRDQAYTTLQNLIKNPNLLKHHLSTEAAMRAIGTYLKNKQDPTIEIEDWGITGLLHDADYELCRDHPEKHTIILEEKIGKDLKPEIMYAIKSHNWAHNKVEPKSLMDWAIFCGDSLTGLIVASALVLPSKQLKDVTPQTVLKRFKEKSFARGTRREEIAMCEERLGLTLEAFISVSLASMQLHHEEIGL